MISVCIISATVHDISDLHDISVRDINVHDIMHDVNVQDCILGPRSKQALRSTTVCALLPPTSPGRTHAPYYCPPFYTRSSFIAHERNHLPPAFSNITIHRARMKPPCSCPVLQLAISELLFAPHDSIAGRGLPTDNGSVQFSILVYPVSTL